MVWYENLKHQQLNFSVSLRPTATLSSFINTKYMYSPFDSVAQSCLTPQQQDSVSKRRICSDNCTCCHTEIEAFYLIQSRYTDTGPTSPSADPITPGAWQGSHWIINFSLSSVVLFYQERDPCRKRTWKPGVVPPRDPEYRYCPVELPARTLLPSVDVVQDQPSLHHTLAVEAKLDINGPVQHGHWTTVGQALHRYRPSS